MRAPTFDLRRIPDVHAASSESGLPGGLSTHYYLCDVNTRFRFGNIPALRAHLADLACALCDGHEFAAADTCNLVLRPTLVACLKNDIHQRRVVFDLDADVDATLPPAPFIRQQFVAWLTEVFPTHDWQAAQCVIFAGSFADKPASAHVYFPDFSFAPGDHNKFANNRALLARLNVRFADYKLKLDDTIHNGGLKLPYMDKWVKTPPPRYRGKSQQLVLCEPVIIETWLDLYNICDPLVIASDAAYRNTIDFPAPVQRPRLEPAVGAPVVYVQPLANIDEIIRRLYDAVPQWNGTPVQRKQARVGQGLEILLPQHVYCPLKRGNHGNSGASFVILRTDRTLAIKCHKANCANKCIEVADPDIENLPLNRRAVLDDYNARFAKLLGGAVAQLPARCDDGTMSELQIMSQKQFIEQQNITNEKFDKLPYPKWWLGNPFARRYDFGITCSPTTRDRRYYNTWQGVRCDVLDFAETLRNKPDAELRALAPNWLSLVETNICQNDADVINYVFNWFAHCFQRPHIKPRVALVLAGPPGCGKGLTANLIVNIYGKPHGVSVNASDMRGNFNSLYGTACVLFIDEMEKVKNAVFDNSKFKSLITEPSGVSNEKYVKERSIDMFQHIIMASNARKIVPMQNHERRYFVQKGDYRLYPDGTCRPYLEFCTRVAGELKNVPSLAAVYTLLMRRDIADFEPQIAPVTKAMWHARYLSMPKSQRFVYRVLYSGNIALRALTLSNDTKAQYEWLCSDWLETESARTGVAQIGVAALDLGYDVFARARMRYPKVSYMFITSQSIISYT